MKSRMNLRLGILLSMCLVSGAIDAVAAEASTAGEVPARPPVLGGLIKESRIVYPLRHEGWEAQGEHLYDMQELGASVRYVDTKHPDRWIDLYFYPAGILGAQGFATAMQNERDALLAAARPGAPYRDMELGATQQFVYWTYRADGRKGEKATGYSLDMQMILREQMLHSAMTLQLDRMYYVKGRMSTPERDLSRNGVRRKLVEFVAGLTGRLQIVSTGGCWNPLPVQALATAQRPGTSLFVLEKDGAENAVVTAERSWLSSPRVRRRTPR